jgi:hypothetical protein
VSSLRDRSEAPRRRMRASGMHPGWACFLAAWASGMFTLAATCTWLTWGMIARPVGMSGPLVLTGIAIALFYIAGCKAEKLTERD